MRAIKSCALSAMLDALSNILTKTSSSVRPGRRRSSILRRGRGPDEAGRGDVGVRGRGGCVRRPDCAPVGGRLVGVPRRAPVAGRAALRAVRLHHSCGKLCRLPRVRGGRARGGGCDAAGVAGGGPLASRGLVPPGSTAGAADGLPRDTMGGSEAAVRLAVRRDPVVLPGTDAG